MRSTWKFFTLVAAGGLAAALTTAPAQAAKPGPSPTPLRLTIASVTFAGPGGFADGFTGCRITVRATLSAPLPKGRYAVEYTVTTQYGTSGSWDSVAPGTTVLVNNPAFLGLCGTDGARLTSIGVLLYSGRTLIASASTAIDPPYTCVASG